MADPGWGGNGVITIRAGLGLGAVAGVLAGIAPQWGLVEGPSRATPSMITSLEPNRAIGGFGVLVVIFLVFAAFVPRLWAWLAGLGLVTALCGASGLVVITGRTSSHFAPDADMSLLGGGRILTVAFWVGMVAVAVMLLGFRNMALAPRPVDDDAAAGAAEEEEDADGVRNAVGRRGQSTPASRKALLAFSLGVAGFIIVIGSSLAVAIGTMALGEMRASEGRQQGRGLAIVAIVLGLIALCLLAALVGVGTLAASPSS